MKLIFCPDCHDVIKLQRETRHCYCGAVWGKYLEDDLHAQISIGAVPLGIANYSLSRAWSCRPEKGMGAHFEAFVIPETCPTVKEGDYEPETNDRQDALRYRLLRQPVPEEKVEVPGELEGIMIWREPCPMIGLNWTEEIHTEELDAHLDKKLAEQGGAEHDVSADDDTTVA